jgi:predicted DNA-binding WGR domain protein
MRNTNNILALPGPLPSLTQLLGPASLPLCIHLQAIDPHHNIARAYSIDASPDLFGHIIIALHWGRIGTRGQGRVVSFPEPARAHQFIRATLRKRRSAQKRIGVAYQLCGLTSSIASSKDITSTPSRVG